MMTLDKKYRDELIGALRVHEISGERVGEVLAEVEAHVVETGENPVEAFGKPSEYAAQVAAHLDKSTGKRSAVDVAISGLAVAVLTIFGSDYLIDGLFAEASTVPFTPKDTAAQAALVVLLAAGVFLLFRAFTATARKQAYGISAGAALVLGVLAQFVIGWTFEDVTPLYVLPRWVAITLGAVLVTGGFSMLARAIRRGRVVYPKAS
jgi:hypothetical protein